VIERRTFLKMGLIAPGALSLPMSVFAAMPDIDALIVDQRYLRVGRIGSTSVSVHVIDGNVTALWFHTLDPMWRKPGFVLAGFTGPDVLFVLEHLAWDRGRRVIQRKQIKRKGKGDSPLISWVIAPVHPSVRA
jgi:hypothetical protein